MRLTPAGDAARMWLPTAVAVLVVTFAFFAAGESFRSVHWFIEVGQSTRLLDREDII